jgi:hypothetical protein
VHARVSCVSPHKAKNARHLSWFERYLWTCAEKRTEWSVVELQPDSGAKSRVGGPRLSIVETDERRSAVTINPEFGNVTGTKDKDYDIIWFTEACLSNVLRLETYIEDAGLAGDAELADFFRRAQHESRKGAEEGKKLLAKRLAASA